MRKANCLINGFHLVQENSLLTPALSSLLRSKGVYVCLGIFKRKTGQCKKDGLKIYKIFTDSSKNEGSCEKISKIYKVRVSRYCF